ncbi:hypothetical protein BCR37DRAFT_383785 [Protomyces lactucae-debilis]|uniref:PH domain-containing protein n=1 Tax=Protomyces lactucae-debilis TaxID=2754530 RepID=A0A1Y2EYC2_PROLT|nr:uncharacterized protein BCR37DRAFT_383785 [Protomyces lactucae-debilis]ORY76106.1 hypothetical protein BCR37DRAFT_383785 [Protomyces lactucae-debilis]
MAQLAGPPGTSPLVPHNQTALTDTPPTRDEQVLKSGALSKRAAHTRTWQKRWFVLRPYGLAYYKNSDEYETRKVMSLDNISGVAVCGAGMSVSPTKSKRGRPLLTLYIRSRRLELLAESEEEAEGWAVALKRALAAHNTTQLPSPTKATDAGLYCLSETEDEAIPMAEAEKVIMQGYLTHLQHYNHHHAASTVDRSSRSTLSHLAQYVKHPMHSAHRSRSASAARHHQARRMRGRRYWCVLRSHSGLFLYADAGEYEVVDIIPLVEMLDWMDLELPEHEALRQTVTSGSHESEGECGGLFVLQLILREESRIFGAVSEQALDEWLGALQSRIEWQRSRQASVVEQETVVVTTP